MRCWRCGKEISDNAGFCGFCGADQNRPVPQTETGRAMRAISNQYGLMPVLSDPELLANELGNRLDDTSLLGNQIRMAMHAGLGNLYLEQLKIGKTDSAFDRKVIGLITEEAGLNEKTAAEIAGAFHEMIGWKPPKAPAPSPSAQTQRTGNSAAPPPQGTGQTTPPPQRTAQTMPPPQRTAQAAPPPQKTVQPAPKKEPEKKGGIKGILIAAVIVGAMYLIGRTLGGQAAKKMQDSSKEETASSTSVVIESTSETEPASSEDTTDLLTDQQTLLYEEMDNDGVEIRLLVCYGDDTHNLKSLDLKYAYLKDAGYSLEGVREWADNGGPDLEMPSFTRMYSGESEQYVIVDYLMDGLENAAKIQELDDCGIIKVYEKGLSAVDATSLIDSLLENGWVDDGWCQF